jgi:Glycolipid 2-alpha-mannosyltransferase
LRRRYGTFFKLARRPLRYTPFTPFFILFLLHSTTRAVWSFLYTYFFWTCLGILGHSIDSWLPHAGTIFRETATIRGQSTKYGIWRSQIFEIHSLCLLCELYHPAWSCLPLLTKNQGLAVIYFISSSSTPKVPSEYLDTKKDYDGIPTKAGTTPNTVAALPPAADGGPKMNATFVTLARNSDLWEIARSIRQVEDRFNRKFHYDWVFLNDKPFDETFKKVTTSLVSGKTFYGEIPKEHWSFPDHIDQDKARKVREDMAQRKIIYGDSISYRHMCRFESGFFFRQELMLNYEWYWRVEPSVELFCDIDYDVFKFMADNKKKYSFVLSLYEYVETIPTLWDSTKKFMKAHPEHIAKDNSMGFLSDDGGETYNHCHMVNLREYCQLFLANSYPSGPTSKSVTSIGSDQKPT